MQRRRSCDNSGRAVFFWRGISRNSENTPVRTNVVDRPTRQRAPRLADAEGVDADVGEPLFVSFMVVVAR